MSRIKAIRKELGLTQVQFADKFGIPVRTIKSWETHNEEHHREAPDYVYDMIQKVVEAERKVTIQEMLDFTQFVKDCGNNVDTFADDEITFELNDVNGIFTDVNGEEIQVEEYLEQILYSVNYKIEYGNGNWVTIKFL